MERLAIVQALYNAVKEAVSTKSPGSLRAEVDEQVRALYEATGAKSFDVKLDGEKVGTFSVVVTKPTEGKVEDIFNIADRGALSEWEIPDVMAYGFARDNINEFARWYFEMTGELPPGCELAEVHTPADPGGRIKNTRFVVDATKVVEVLGNGLGAAARELLEGGTDD